MRQQGKPAMSVAHDNHSVDVSEDAAAAIVATGGTLARTQTQYSTAISVQRPRARKAVQAAVLEEAELAGEDFFYSWTTKNKDGTRGLVEGLSIEGAMILARNWGNCAIPTELLVDAPQHWIICATFVDLETGFNVPRLFRQRKGQTAGKMDADRQLDIAFQIGQSKAQRNAIDKAMPNWLKDAALEKAKATSEGKFKDVPAANAKAVTAYGRLGVTQRQLEEKLGLKMEHWTARDHVSLDGLYRAIRDRQTTVSEEFPKEAPPQPQEEAAPKSEPAGYDDGPGGAATNGSSPQQEAAKAAASPPAATRTAPAAAAPSASPPTNPFPIPDLDTTGPSAAAPRMSPEDIKAAQDLDRGEKPDAAKQPAAKTKPAREPGEEG